MGWSLKYLKMVYLFGGMVTSFIAWIYREFCLQVYSFTAPNMVLSCKVVYL